MIGRTKVAKDAAQLVVKHVVLVEKKTILLLNAYHHKADHHNVNVCMP